MTAPAVGEVAGWKLGAATRSPRPQCARSVILKSTRLAAVASLVVLGPRILLLVLSCLIRTQKTRENGSTAHSAMSFVTTSNVAKWAAAGKFALRTRPKGVYSCVLPDRMHLCGCWKIERATCDAFLDAQLVMRTFMPIYYNPNPPPAKDTKAYEDYGTKHDQELRDEIIGTVTVQNIPIPTGPCCANPAGCPLIMSIDLKPEYADTIDDDREDDLGFPRGLFDLGLQVTDFCVLFSKQCNDFLGSGTCCWRRGRW